MGKKVKLDAHNITKINFKYFKDMCLKIKTEGKLKDYLGDQIK